ncbi:chaperonin 10-like protein [Jimgerdemannia flammicorona]|uniref:Chaperonin 10-like protein n=1 Tax=Jimgerdemannia flammicorona TaxID=994334 RepID=A0A433QU06_9FUNG|nr:chaperonin 10-like protein [Jimgerdemannia flammicorona]
MFENTNYSVVLVKQGEIVPSENPKIPLPTPLFLTLSLLPTLPEVQVNIKVTGICGSDVHYWAHGGIGDFKLKAPMVLGHESAGVVSALGPGVTHLKVGDRVALEPGICCRVCEQCKNGRLPANVTLEEGALVEPLSVAVHAANRSGLKAGDRVFVFGAGPVGLLICAMAKAAGAAHVTIAEILFGKFPDIASTRLDFAKTYYTDSQVLLERAALGEPNIEYARRTARYILGELGEELADIVIDATGAETCVQTAFYVSSG